MLLVDWLHMLSTTVATLVPIWFAAELTSEDLNFSKSQAMVILSIHLSWLRDLGLCRPWVSWRLSTKMAWPKMKLLLSCQRLLRLVSTMIWALVQTSMSVSSRKERWKCSATLSQTTSRSSPSQKATISERIVCKFSKSTNTSWLRARVNSQCNLAEFEEL